MIEEWLKRPLLDIKERALSAATKSPPLHHMLVFPQDWDVDRIELKGYDDFYNQQQGFVWISESRSVFDISCDPSILRHWHSSGEPIDTELLPPKGFWPGNLPPLRPIVVRNHDRPFRIHAFFGSSDGWIALLDLATNLRELEHRLIDRKPNVLFFDMPGLVHSLEQLLNSIHMYAARRGSRIPIQQVELPDDGDRKVESGQGTGSGSPPFFSLLKTDIFTATAHTIDGIVEELNRLDNEPLPISEETRSSSDTARPAQSTEHKPTHAPDFTSVDWYGAPYFFAIGHQAESVEVLWAAFESGGHSVSQSTIANKLDAGVHFRLEHVFRRRKKGSGYESHPAWGTMIQPAASKGCFRLVPPDSS